MAAVMRADDAAPVDGDRLPALFAAGDLYPIEPIAVSAWLWKRWIIQGLLDELRRVAAIKWLRSSSALAAEFGRHARCSGVAQRGAAGVAQSGSQLQRSDRPAEKRSSLAFMA